MPDKMAFVTPLKTGNDIMLSVCKRHHAAVLGSPHTIRADRINQYGAEPDPAEIKFAMSNIGKDNCADVKNPLKHNMVL